MSNPSKNIPIPINHMIGGETATSAADPVVRLR